MKERKEFSITFRVTEQMKQELDQLCYKKNESLSAIIRKAVENEIEKERN